MHVDRKTFVCAIPGCGKRTGLDMRRTAKGKAQWRCSEHQKGTEQITTPQRPSKEKSA